MKAAGLLLLSKERERERERKRERERERDRVTRRWPPRGCGRYDTEHNKHIVKYEGVAS